MKGSTGLLWIVWSCGILISHSLSAQFFETKVTESKIYRLTLTQAKKLGFKDFSEVSFFGYPGMLPQKLDSTQLHFQEIPAFQKGEALYVYLQGPHSSQWDENGHVQYYHHLYEDTLSYLIGKNPNPKRIQLNPSETGSHSENPILYRFYAHKEEKINILNSGRTWYSDPIRQGQSLNINLGLKSTSSKPWLLIGAAMSQSSASSTMRVLVADLLLQEIQFTPIPNTTYGLKGDVKTFAIEVNPNGGQLSQLRVTFQGTGSGYLDFIMVGVPYDGNAWENGVFQSKYEQFIPLPKDRLAWEVSDFYNPKQFSGFVGKGRKWVFFSESAVPDLPVFGTKDLNLRQTFKSSELLIIAPSQLLYTASKLQAHKESIGIPTQVANLQEIYAAFGYGNSDLTAIRNFIAWKYHTSKTLKNVLILGKGTFDYKRKLGGRPNLVPVYTSRSSLNPLTTYSSDDYFVLVDWGQGEWKESREGDELLQIGIGRIPVINGMEANAVVEKIIRYESGGIPGSWKRNLTFLADDGDNNIHLRDAESLGKYLTENHPDFFLNKQYLDRYEQVTTGTSQSSPQAKQELLKAMEEGTLLVNFIGHGNETTLTAEEIFSVGDLKDWPEMEVLPVWMTATCEFGRVDSPLIRSAAEELLTSKNKGAIALFSTGRPVFSSINYSLNQAFVQQIFRKEKEAYQDLGSIYKNTKNQSQNGAFNRNFSLLGDPSLRMAIPELTIEITSLKSKAGPESDTIRTHQEIQVFAEIRDPLSNAFLPGFEGKYLIEVYGQPESQLTQGDESSPISFEEESNRIFKGTGEVKSGKLEAKFWIGHQASPKLGIGKIRLLALSSQNSQEAMGSKSIILLPENPTSSDKTGPEIHAAINQNNSGPFISANKSIQLDLKLTDHSGINSSSFDLNQLLSYQLNEEVPVFMGDKYIAENGSYTSGTLSTAIQGLREGINQLTIRAWDNLGNGTVKNIPIEVSGSEQLRIISHKVYPNPATEKASFEISHNRPGETLFLKLELYSLTAEILYSETFRYVKAQEKIENLTWKFFQSRTKYPAKGTYIYKLSLQAETDNQSAHVSGKLAIE